MRGRFLLPRHRQIFDAPGLGAYGLRVERHQLQNFIGNIGAHGKAELFGFRRRDGIVVRPRSSGQLFRERFRLLAREAAVERQLEMAWTESSNGSRASSLRTGNQAVRQLEA